MRRRKFLQTAPVTTGYGLAAIQSVDAEQINDGPRDQEPTVLRSFYHLPHPDAPELNVNQDGQYLFVPVTAPTKSNDPDRVYPSVKRYHLVTDEERIIGSKTINGASLSRILMWHSTLGRPYTPRVGSGILAYDVSEGIDTENAYVEYHRKNRQNKQVNKLSSSTIRALKKSPSFVVENVDIPAVITRGETATVSIRVSNNGSRDGSFRAIFGIAESPHKSTVTFTIPSGDQVTREVRFKFPPHVPEGDVDEHAQSVEYELDWGTNSTTRVVAIEDR